MPYPTLPGRRFEYDVGGGSVYYGNDVNDITTPLTSEQMALLNGIGNTSAVISKDVTLSEVIRTVWVFLPERYVIAGLGMIHKLSTSGDGCSISIAGSADSTQWSGWHLDQRNIVKRRDSGEYDRRRRMERQHPAVHLLGSN